MSKKEGREKLGAYIKKQLRGTLDNGYRSLKRGRLEDLISTCVAEKLLQRYIIIEKAHADTRELFIEP